MHGLDGHEVRKRPQSAFVSVGTTHGIVGSLIDHSPRSADRGLRAHWPCWRTLQPMTSPRHSTANFLARKGGPHMSWLLAVSLARKPGALLRQGSTNLIIASCRGVASLQTVRERRNHDDAHTFHCRGSALRTSGPLIVHVQYNQKIALTMPLPIAAPSTMLEHRMGRGCKATKALTRSEAYTTSS